MKLKTIVLTMCLIIMAAYNVHAQTQTGYRIPPRADIGGGRMTGDMWCQYGTNGVRFKIGTQTVTQVGTAGVINGTNAASLPSLDFTYGGGSMSANFNGFGSVYVAGSQVGTSGALVGKLDAVSGVGTNNAFNNPTLAGVGMITASFGANGLVISPTEYSSLDGVSSNIQTQIDTKLTKVNGVNTYIGSITAGGKTGTSSVAHNAGSNMTITSTVTADGGLSITYDASGTLTSSFGNLTGSPLDNGTLTPYIPFVRTGTAISPGTITDTVRIGTTTQHNNSVVTILGSSTSALSVITHRGYTGTTTTAIMTGTSTPAPYQVLVSSTYSAAYPGYEAFDGIVSGGAGNAWAANGDTNQYIIYDYGTGSKKAIGSYQIIANIADGGGANNAPNTFDLRGSNDNVSYTSIDSRAGEGIWTALETRSYTVATSTTAYQFYKVHVTSINGGANATIGEIHLIEKLFDNYPSLCSSGSGTVGIGTTTPLTPLHVIGNVTIDGTILIAETTALNVPDYVFAEDYKLISLDELKEYIEENQHLPGFESAKSSKELNLVQDNMRLREAIEKLTLYMFQLKDTQQKEINSLKLLLNK